MTFSVSIASIIAVVESVTGFNVKTEIPNPYSIPDNASTFLTNGYGYRIGGSSVTFQEWHNTNDDQQLGIILSREIVKTDGNPEVVRAAIEQIKLDATNLRTELLKCTSLDGVNKLTYESTDPFEFSDGHIYTTVNFNYVVIDAINNC